MDTIFDKIVRGEFKSWTVWQNEEYLAFLTPFACMPGQTVLIPKVNLGDNLFSLETTNYLEFLKAAKTVAHILEQAFHTPRVAMVIEGTGVPYAHIKLYPLVGDLTIKPDEPVRFFETYPGFLITVEGNRVPDELLDSWQKTILTYSGSESAPSDKRLV